MPILYIALMLCDLELSLHILIRFQLISKRWLHHTNIANNRIVLAMQFTFILMFFEVLCRIEERCKNDLQIIKYYGNLTLSVT